MASKPRQLVKQFVGQETFQMSALATVFCIKMSQSDVRDTMKRKSFSVGIRAFLPPSISGRDRVIGVLIVLEARNSIIWLLDRLGTGPLAGLMAVD